MIEWHHLFGLGLIDYFTNSCYQVEVEKDLSTKKQRLDVLIIEQGSGQPIAELPDGLENLARRNLMTYKSPRQPLDAWTLDELIGHYVNYRKQSSPSFDDLLPVEEFSLYAVATRHPEKLESEVALRAIKQGVYEVQWGSRKIRIIVLSEVAKIERNALWLLFSGVAEKVQYGASQYQTRQPDLSTVMNRLYASYKLEGIPMPYTVEDYKRDLKEETLSWLTLEERLKGLTPEERLRGLPPEERLRGLPTEERLRGLPTDEILKILPLEELLRKLSREEIEAYLKKLSASN
ncbi:MAG: hypothetical protein AAB354_13105 [candidate division KSB1 bacterium]